MHLLQVWVCEIRYVGTTELKNIPYISARAACTINYSVKEM